MIKIFLFMYICSTVPGNECKQIPIKTNGFNDMYDCTVYGYQYSSDLIKELDREFVNEHGAYTKFMCIPQPII
jgi:hypothetical protein